MPKYLVTPIEEFVTPVKVAVSSATVGVGVSCLLTGGVTVAIVPHKRPGHRSIAQTAETRDRLMLAMSVRKVGGKSAAEATSCR